MSRNEYLLAEIARKIENLVVYGEIKKISDDFRFADIEFEGETVEGLPILERQTLNKNFAKPLLVGEVAIVLCASGELAHGIIIGVLRTEANKNTDKTYHYVVDEEVDISYDYDAKILKVKAREVEITLNAKNNNCEIKAKQVTVISDTCDVKAQKANVYSEQVFLGKENDAAALGVVTGACICAYTGTVHPDASSVVKASK